MRKTVAVYCPDAAKLVAEGDQIRLVTVYWAGLFDARAERETGAAPATGTTKPVTPTDVIALGAAMATGATDPVTSADEIGAEAAEPTGVTNSVTLAIGAGAAGPTGVTNSVTLAIGAGAAGASVRFANFIVYVRL